jgi:hypothetical protein
VAGNDATRHQMDDTKLAWSESVAASRDGLCACPACLPYLPKVGLPCFFIVLSSIIAQDHHIINNSSILLR